MRKKSIAIGASLLMSCLLGASAISNAFALYTKGANVASFNIGEQPKVGYYIVGSGSFVPGGKSDWTTDGGVQMYQQTGYKGALKHQYLTAGDVFKLTNGTSEWYGWGENAADTDVTNFRTAYYDFYEDGTWKNYDGGNGDTTADGNHTYYCHSSSDYFYRIHKWNDSVSTTWPGVVFNHNPSDKVYGFDSGRRYNNQVMTKCLFTGDNDKKMSSDDLVFTSNGNIVVATTGYYDVYLTNDTNAKIKIVQAS